MRTASLAASSRMARRQGCHRRIMTVAAMISFIFGCILATTITTTTATKAFFRVVGEIRASAFPIARPSALSQMREFDLLLTVYHHNARESGDLDVHRPIALTALAKNDQILGWLKNLHLF